jgi:hypothetical protein
MQQQLIGAEVLLPCGLRVVISGADPREVQGFLRRKVQP